MRLRRAEALDLARKEAQALPLPTWAPEEQSSVADGVDAMLRKNWERLARLRESQVARVRKGLAQAEGNESATGAHLPLSQGAKVPSLLSLTSYTASFNRRSARIGRDALPPDRPPANAVDNARCSRPPRPASRRRPRQPASIVPRHARSDPKPRTCRQHDAESCLRAASSASASLSAGGAAASKSPPGLVRPRSDVGRPDLPCTSRPGSEAAELPAAAPTAAAVPGVATSRLRLDKPGQLAHARHRLALHPAATAVAAASVAAGADGGRPATESAVAFAAAAAALQPIRQPAGLLAAAVGADPDDGLEGRVDGAAVAPAKRPTSTRRHVVSDGRPRVGRARATFEKAIRMILIDSSNVSRVRGV